MKTPQPKATWAWVIFAFNIFLVGGWEWKIEWAFLLCSVLVSVLTLVKLKELSQTQVICLGMGLSVLYTFGVEADDDVHRYLVEGWALFHEMNPYLTPPSQILSEVPTQALVNHPEWTAIYGPLFLQIMAGWTGISTSVVGVKILFLSLHVFNTWLIRKLRKEMWWGYYLCSPFVLFETVGQAHLEGLVVLGGLLLLLGMEKSKQMVFALGLLFGFWVKWWALPLLPVLFRKKVLGAWLMATTISAILLWPFISEPTAMFVSLKDFEGLWTNGYPRLWLEWMFGEWAILPVGLAMVGLLVVVLLLGGSLNEQIWQFFRLGLLLSPTLHPWYWVMPLTMALMSGKVATFTLVGAAAMALHHPEFSLSAGEGWQSSFWSFTPILILSMLSEWRIRRHVLGERGDAPESLSIVTPVLNEAENLKELGGFLSHHRNLIKEWVVVDGGSEDNSPGIARKLGAQVIEPGIKGRGAQIRYGAEQASSDWVMVVHADTRFEMGFFEGWYQEISKVPGADGGAFRMAYRGKLSLGPLMFLNDLKMRWFGMSFGDQTQFFKKSSLENKGGFPELPLMEDVELSMTLKGGNVIYLDRLISWTSPRRWEARGRLSNAVQIIRLLMSYLWKRHWNPPVDVRAMYRSYYPS